MSKFPTLDGMVTQGVPQAHSRFCPLAACCSLGQHLAPCPRVVPFMSPLLRISPTWGQYIALCPHLAPFPHVSLCPHVTQSPRVAPCRVSPHARVSPRAQVSVCACMMHITKCPRVALLSVSPWARMSPCACPHVTKFPHVAQRQFVSHTELYKDATSKISTI